MFGAGAAASFAAHEGAHYAVAKSRGYDIHRTGWNRFSYSEDGHSVSADTDLRMAGLVANAVSSEAILALTDKERRHPFWKGMLLANTIEEVTYPTLKGDRLDFAEGKVYHRDGWRYGIAAHGASVAARAYGPRVKRWWVGGSPAQDGALFTIGWRW